MHEAAVGELSLLPCTAGKKSLALRDPRLGSSNYGPFRDPIATRNLAVIGYLQNTAHSMD